MLQPRDVLLLARPGTEDTAEGTLLCSIPSLLQILSVSYLSLLPPETIPGCLFAAFSILMAERLHCTSFPNSGAHSRGFFTQCDFQKKCGTRSASLGHIFTCSALNKPGHCQPTANCSSFLCHPPTEHPTCSFTFYISISVPIEPLKRAILNVGNELQDHQVQPKHFLVGGWL